MEMITVEWLVATACIFMSLIAAYNTFYTGRKNMREERKLKTAPTASLEERVKSHESRLTELETDLKDTRDGQKYMIRGIQALLEHELHNGNADQMQDASNEIAKWLTNKI